MTQKKKALAGRDVVGARPLSQSVHRGQLTVTSRDTGHFGVRHGGDDAEDDEPPGLCAEYAECGGGQGGQPQQGGEAGAGARQQGGDGQGREGEEAEVSQGPRGE